jgi:hypothetical protein
MDIVINMRYKINNGVAQNILFLKTVMLASRYPTKEPKYVATT